jgi:hypothetical protein
MSKGNRIEAIALTYKAIKLQLSNDDGGLKEVEDVLLKAVAVDSKCIDALQETAHFYDAVLPRADRAKRYAASCKSECQQIISEMDAILAEE